MHVSQFHEHGSGNQSLNDQRGIMISCRIIEIGSLVARVPVFGRAKDGQCATSVACTARASAWWLPVGWQSCSGVRPMEICLTDVCIYNHIQASCKILRV